MTEKLKSILEAEELTALLEKFNEQGVADSILGDLTDSDLRELGIEKLGERRRLLRAFSQACEAPPNKPRENDSKPSITTSPQEDFTYSAANGEITITGYRGRGHVVIPDKFDDLPLPVRKIGDAAFRDNGMILSVVIPQGCTDIGRNAFFGCSSMETVEIPSSVNDIGYSAFVHCSRLKSVTIPNGVTSIGDVALYGSIADSAFRFCKRLERVTIPNSVTSIGQVAFEGCSSLKSVTIPDRVTSIGVGAFEGCKSLVNLKIPGKVTSIGAFAFIGCKSLESLTIPNSVTSIGEDAFASCQPAVLKAYMQWRKSNSPSILTDPKLNPVVQQILKQVDELSEFYNKANSKDRWTMVRNIRESYEEECKIASRSLRMDEFIVNIQKSIGWDFAFPDSPIDQSIEK